MVVYYFTVGSNGKPTGAVVTVSPDATVKDLLGVLASHNIGAVIVSSDGSAVDGIVSERDLPTFLDQCRLAANATVDEKNWLKMMSGETIADNDVRVAVFVL